MAGVVSISTMIATEMINVTRMIWNAVSDVKLGKFHWHWTHSKKEDSHPIELPSPCMNLPSRDRTLLPPKSIGADCRNQNCHAMTSHGEWDADLVEPQTVHRGVCFLETEKLGDQDPLHGDHHGGADVGEERSFER